MKIAPALLCLSLLACARAQASAPLNPEAFEAGVNVHTGALPALLLAKDLGVTWIRMDLNWDGIEPKPGLWNFKAPDQTIAAAQSLGLKVYATLAYAPAWARQGPDSSSVPDPGAWKNFAAKVARRYCGRVQAYGIWNEPNLEEFWSGTAEQYVEILLKPAYAAIKSEDPAALVAGPELAHLYSARLGIQEFFEALASLGGGECLDILSHHVYSSAEFPEKLFGYFAGDMAYRPGLAQMLKSAGLNPRQVWLTEIGSNARESGEAAQAEQLVSQLRFVKRQGWVKKAFIYQLGDDSDEGPQWGLARRDGTLRPAYYDLRSLIRNGF